MDILKNAVAKHETYQLENYKISISVLSTFLIAACTVLVVSVTIPQVFQYEDTIFCKSYILISRITKILNTLCILLLGASLYSYVLRLNRLVADIRKVCEKLSRPQNTSASNSGDVVNSSILAWFLTIEMAAYISFALFIISLLVQSLF